MLLSHVSLDYLRKGILFTTHKLQLMKGPEILIFLNCTTKAIFTRKPTFNPVTLNKTDHDLNYLLTSRRIYKRFKKTRLD